MKINLPLECLEYFEYCKTNIIGFDRTPSSISLNQKEVEDFLPHRPPLLLISSVENLDKKNTFIQATCDLSQHEHTLKSFNPNNPQMPEVMQMEAIGQASLILNLHITQEKTQAVQITNLFLCEFMHSIHSPGVMDIRATAFEHGYFQIAIGQCIFQNQISSIAIVQGLTYI